MRNILGLSLIKPVFSSRFGWPFGVEHKGMHSHTSFSVAFLVCRVWALNGATEDDIEECKTHLEDCGKATSVYGEMCEGFH